MILESFQSKLKHEQVRWFTNNQNLVKRVQYGSANSSLQAEALDFFICVQDNIQLESKRIPRKQNKLPEYFS